MTRTPQQIAARAQRILDAGINAAKRAAARSRIEEMTLHTLGYSEPGYDGQVIVLGNYNTIGRWEEVPMKWVEQDDTPKRVGELLGRAGVEIEWSDEWVACDWCGKLVRTKPSSYSWQQSYWQHPLGIYCHECVRNDPSEYLRYLEGRETSAETLNIDLEEHGYILAQDNYEHGFHPGQEADPKLIGEALRQQGITRFIFRLDSTGQFDCSFSVYVHRDEIVKLDREKFESSQTDGPSVADGLRRALADASRKMDAMPDASIKIASCDVSSGTATVKTLTPQEFVEGLR